MSLLKKAKKAVKKYAKPAGIGAAVGTLAGGPAGAALGAGLGAGAGIGYTALKDKLGGGGSGDKRVDNWNAEQKDAFSRLAASNNPRIGSSDARVDSLIQGDVTQGFDENVAAPTRRAFEQNTLPAIGAQHANNYWSTIRMNREDKARGDMEADLATKRYAAQEAANQRSLDALQYSPEQRSLAMLGLDPYTHIVKQKKDTWDKLAALGSLASGGAAVYGAVK